ncbi:uncharacterized protein KQ657_003234 [Scheffersomyces spartinae]|uniref:Cation-transporting ATPase n=1 Tax=Scheffersomyces spartinae TaxID=45513 RepID=A0A9P7VCV8_9ASCO|nr:uncharacterized protein KQ657_003234 [Scheffersomyces spartinae]KAG7195472.1 hypothetical protein KQ657_003234 [Scheffersomyces spartinae]
MGRQSGRESSERRRSSLSRRSSSLSRWRSRSDSLSSVGSTGSQFLDDNTNEIYSGAGSEIIPSSITSFHYPHHFGRSSHRKSVVSGISDFGRSPPVHSHNDNEDDEAIDGVSVRSGSGQSLRSDEIQMNNFKFFSPDEIEMAPGGSTLENPENPVDFDTAWDYSVDKYIVEEEPLQDHRRKSDSSSVTPDYDYGSIIYEGGRNRRDSDSSSSKHVLLEENENELLRFYEQYPATSEYQRYYLAEEDLVIGIAGYKSSWPRTTLYYLFCIFTCGLGYLAMRWFPKFRVNMKGNKSPLGKADWAIIENEYGELVIVNIDKTAFNERLSDFLTSSPQEGEDLTSRKLENDPVVPYLQTFNYRYVKFFYNPVEDLFKTNSNWYDPRWLYARNMKDGIPQSVQEERLEIFGQNNIIIEEKSVVQILADEVLHPFYVFQIFSIFLWMADDYYYYAGCIFVISLISVLNSLIETKQTIHRLQEISKLSCEIRVWRHGFWKQIDSHDLVPGDVFEVDPTLAVLPCDAILINGECVVNESMLTGESVPVSKVQATQETAVALPESFTSPLLAKSFLYNGTKLLKTKSSNDEPVCAMCFKTGFNTTKGSLVRSMLFPKPIGFKFYQDSFKYIGFMGLIACIGFTYSTYNFIKVGLDTRTMILRALDIITIVVPPALPATLTIGTTFALSRLKKLQIFCISPTRVNVGGKLDVVCFDKTGTLTEDGLDVLGVHLAINAKGRKEIVFDELVSDIGHLDVGETKSSSHELKNGKYLLGGMASCHSLRLIDNEVLGDPLDVRMFEFTKWQLSETTTNVIVHSPTFTDDSYAIAREFDFAAALRRMSVVVDSESRRFVFTKGAPEIMYNVCNNETLPTNFEDLLHHYTHSGFRVIACAYKEISQEVNISDFDREEIESDLTFTGFIVFENKLKPATKATLQELERAKIRTVMCTGDNILTAISVGRECELISPDINDVYVPTLHENEFGMDLIWEEVINPGKILDPNTLQPSIKGEKFTLAITGDVFRYMLTEMKDEVDQVNTLLLKGSIFARMSPDEKHELVERLQALDYTVGFCGDGANDCGALKAADVGISLSEAEASVAAPFTSRIFEVSCVVNVIKEGRSSLVTSFSCFKYMSLYSAIQFITVTCLYKEGTNLGDFQFLYIDLFLILPLAIFMSWSGPFGELVIKRPSANLVAPKILIPMCCHIIVIMIFQVTLWLHVQKQPWYIKPVVGGDDEVKSSDNTVLFLFTNFQYILIAVLLSSGPPYREPMTKNVPFMINVFLATLISILLFGIDENTRLGDFMDLTNLSSFFYALILVSAVLNLIVMMAGDKFLYSKITWFYKKIFRRSQFGVSKKKYKNLLREMGSTAFV